VSEKKIRKKYSKQEILRMVRNYSLVLLATIVLAFADAAFITPCKIVSGGVASIGIILNHYLEPLWGFDTNSLIVSIVQVVLLIVGLIFVGKEFAVKTAFSSLMFPALFALFMWLDIGKVVGLSGFYEKVASGDMGYMILAAIFGGALVGVGVALGYLGNGSTGGLDVISAIIAKHTDMKQDVSGFIMDAILVVIGIAVFKDIGAGLVGVLAAFACALSVQYAYISLNSFVIVDIISDQVPAIQDYIHNSLEHASTIIDMQGGYSGEKRKMVRVVIYHEEQAELRQFIASVDPKAFVSFTTATAINGEGFDPLSVKKRKESFSRQKKTKTISNVKSLQNKDTLTNNQHNEGENS